MRAPGCCQVTDELLAMILCKIIRLTMIILCELIYVLDESTSFVFKCN